MYGVETGIDHKIVEPREVEEFNGFANQIPRLGENHLPGRRLRMNIVSPTLFNIDVLSVQGLNGSPMSKVSGGPPLLAIAEEFNVSFLLLGRCRKYPRHLSIEPVSKASAYENMVIVVLVFDDMVTLPLVVDGPRQVEGDVPRCGVHRPGAGLGQGEAPRRVLMHQ